MKNGQRHVFLFMIEKNMTYFLTFVASDLKNSPLNTDFLSFLHDYGYGDEDNIAWLQPNRAVDISLESEIPLQEIHNLRRMLDTRQVDVFLTPAENRKKKLLLADMDCTIVVGETLDELSSFAGVKEQVEQITTRAMNGELEFQAALKERVALLQNLSAEALEETARALQIMPGAQELVRTMKENGAKTVLVTGGFTFFSDDVADILGFDHAHGNTLEISEGLLTGNVIPPIIDQSAKLDFLKRYQSELNLQAHETMAIGDGANDLPMLQHAGLGVGYQPKQVLEEVLTNVIKHNDLSAALYAQGYRNFEN